MRCSSLDIVSGVRQAKLLGLVSLERHTTINKISYCRICLGSTLVASDGIKGVLKAGFRAHGPTVAPGDA